MGDTREAGMGWGAWGGQDGIRDPGEDKLGWGPEGRLGQDAGPKGGWDGMGDLGENRTGWGT